MAITTMDGLVAALSADQPQYIGFPSNTPQATGGFTNFNTAGVPSFGTLAAPTAFGSGGTTFNQSGLSVGVPKWTAAGGGNTTYIGQLTVSANGASTFLLYDLLWAASGFAGNVATAQNVVSFSGMPARNTNGVAAEIWIGCSSAIGTTAHNVTVGYTNQAGTSGRTTVSQAGITSQAANRMYRVQLQSGDTGVQSVQSLTLSASSGTAGNLWVLVMKPISILPVMLANVGNVYDFASIGLPAISDESCLLFVHQATGTSAILSQAKVDIIQG